MSEHFLYKPFNQININDSFFDSLKADYIEFEDWFNRKSNSGDHAFIQLVDNNLEGFLYLKIENGPIHDVEPSLNVAKALKIGTFKINPHGTRLGERFIKKSLDYAINNNISVVYVTIFSHHEYLLNMFLKFGFTIYGRKTTDNGEENVLVKDINNITSNLLLDYPLIDSNSKSFLLAIKPEYHTKLFPDSKLYNETFDIIEDVSHTNSITKIYIAKMSGMSSIKANDNLVIYRTGDGQGYARFRAVATTICTVEDSKSIREFSTFDDLKNFCKNYSIFPDNELHEFFTSGDSYYVIKMIYNVSLPKRIIRGRLLDEVGMNGNCYWGLLPLTNTQFNEIIHLGEVNSKYIK